MTSGSVSHRERLDRRRSHQLGPRAVNCKDNKDKTLMALGLVRGDRSYDLRGDGVAEDMMLLTCCFNTSTPELSAVWCLENGKGVFRSPLKIRRLYKTLVVVMRSTSKPLSHLSQGRYCAWYYRKAFVALIRVVQDVCICYVILSRIPLEASGKIWP